MHNKRNNVLLQQPLLLLLLTNGHASSPPFVNQDHKDCRHRPLQADPPVINGQCPCNRRGRMRCKEEKEAEDCPFPLASSPAAWVDNSNEVLERIVAASIAQSGLLCCSGWTITLLVTTVLVEGC
jgi:hypothetical protein